MYFKARATQVALAFYVKKAIDLNNSLIGYGDNH